jgi:hypothetical protein
MCFIALSLPLYLTLDLARQLIEPHRVLTALITRIPNLLELLERDQQDHFCKRLVDDVLRLTTHRDLREGTPKDKVKV